MDVTAQPPAALGELLRRLRLAAGMTQDELATKAGLSLRALGDIERGRTLVPYRQSMRALADALDLSRPRFTELMRAAYPTYSQSAGTQDNACGQDDRSAATRARTNELPAGITDFVGRESPLAQLTQATVASQKAAADTVGLLCVDGMAGIGKTAMVVHAAHRVGDHFRDGILYTELRAHASDARPPSTAAVLASLLRRVGVADDRVPDSIADRMLLWRAVMATRHMLVIFDDATHSHQIRSLLPGAGASMVLVTSRKKLADLDADTTISLDVLTPAEAACLFMRVARIAPGATTDRDIDIVTEMCGYLPLAIRIAGARLRSRPSWTVTHQAARLARDSSRLAELVLGDRSVSETLGQSFGKFSAAQRGILQELSLRRTEAFDARVLATLGGYDLSRARRWLDVLVEDNVVIEQGPDRYTFHRLMRDALRAATTDRAPAPPPKEMSAGVGLTA
ncbi:XRE family transcriptional regulator [Fodinicola acaciae]|uniref:XRE family transcriptional regulator n=1 Tax=Fodinicola acaciae TaxID=2681555 RepID=UPI0013D5434A|nr:XRE family transcriptional regulator [Fodinicola acaciae]